jgi:hypothetical protein
MFVEAIPLTLGLSTTLGYAKIAWSDVIAMAQGNEILRPEVGQIRYAIGEEVFPTAAGAGYRIAAANRRAGRSLTVHRLIVDEIREHTSWDAWNASTNAGNAVPGFQAVCISNQGDDTSTVLDALRGSALTYLETGVGDPRLGLLEWSSPDGSDPTDLAALAMANPNLNRRIDQDALLGAAARAKAAGGEELAGHQTEVMCMRVRQLDPAIDPTGWSGSGTTTPVNLAEHRNRVALCVDVSLDGSHATLVAAAVLDGKVHVEVVQQWTGFGCTKQLRADLPALVAKIRPRALGWFPTGPAAAVAADLADRGARNWPPRRCRVEEIRGEVSQVCMGLADLVTAGEVIHPDDDMLNAHIAGASKLWRGDVFVYARRGRSPVDGCYALAGAVHLARTLPPPLAPVEVAR